MNKIRIWSRINFAFCLILLAYCPELLIAQDKPQATAFYTENPPKIDGNITDEVWGKAKVLSHFRQNFPTDTLPAQYPTHIRFLFDDTYLYISIEAKSSGSNFVATSLKRDFRGSTTDNVSFFFDTFMDGVNAYQFGVNPYGAQRESLVSDGGIDRNSFNPNWDVKWFSEGHIQGDTYVAELAIPFYSVKYPEGCTQWNMQAYRFDLQTNERSTWSRIDQNQLLSNLGYLGVLTFDRPLPKNNNTSYFIPYVNLSRAHDFQADQPRTDDAKVGFDVKIPIGSQMNLDLTLNPDFSNVEVDDLINNISRFEVSLPEKRQFFLDNSDLFSSFGNPRDASPFFSRRIGIATDLEGNTIQNDIIGGLRLSGKLNSNLRLGLLSLQTKADQVNGIPSNNNSMIALQQRVFGRSQLGLFVINREATGDQVLPEDYTSFNRVMGLDYSLASSNNKWTGKFFAHKSISENDASGNLSGQAQLRFNNRFWNIFTLALFVDEEFESDLGFIPRTGFIKKADKVTRVFYPKSGSVNTHELGVYNEFYFAQDLDYKQTDQTLKFEYIVNYKNQSRLELNYFMRYVYLFDDFDPTRGDDALALPMGSEYNYNSWALEYNAQPAGLFTWGATATTGQFFNGKRIGLKGRINYRSQPNFNMSIDFDYNDIRLAAPYPSAKLFLIAPKLEWTFTKNLFWSNFIQYSNFSDNFGINSRLQWRFAPMSDLFIVYNDGYDSVNFYKRYRSINLKLNYWFNI